jgi:hypothetical protein
MITLSLDLWFSRRVIQRREACAFRQLVGEGRRTTTAGEAFGCFVVGVWRSEGISLLTATLMRNWDMSGVSFSLGGQCPGAQSHFLVKATMVWSLDMSSLSFLIDGSLSSNTRQ